VDERRRSRWAAGRGDVAWLDTVDVSLLPAAAREALERGDSSHEALLTAVRGIAQAEEERGG
jgi:hypothetical protein